MTTNTPTCSLCGEPMPAGEGMFKFHGYSGGCPKPPLPSQPTELEALRAKVAQLEKANEQLFDLGQKMFNSEMALKTRVVELEKDAARLRGIRQLCGYVEDGSSTVVKLFQDDATKDWFVKINEKEYYYAKSLNAAIDNAMEESK